MEKISPDKKQEIVNALQEKGAVLPCPRCNNNNFTLLDGYFNQSVQVEPKNLVLGGESVPSVVVVCNKCGYMSQHAIGVLNLIPKEEERHDKK